MSQSFDYKGYWEQTYSSGETSGRGSYGVLAEFKAEVVNGLIQREGISSVIEFGCGDGNQLQYMNYEMYLGVDVAGSSVRLCASKFASDTSKSFMLYTPGLWINRGFLQADLTVCLDVLYHITDETDFRNTLYDILHASSELVVLYTRLKENGNPGVSTIQDRNIFDYLFDYPEFKVQEIIPQRYPDQSSADFVILRRTPEIKNKSV
ncbi:class I SAM-dependent methyltransferase [Paenibacillus sp. UMB7766-LJ446]|uniref:class I SAM-dependent methyltransferase n=1 Tax=Paenibacillus sp. UMB7766-LJ446 TaxID=3046313 RepID=UPI00254FCBF0|nr:class I SAM-dependent methyltransferase [Paenibacillus sp. UMB7766-LJ446]MDK8192832.1 class I SAM-dependent methyltransferase [Paenibacillus sp. UMB7766-LJ446]